MNSTHRANIKFHVKLENNVTMKFTDTNMDIIFKPDNNTNSKANGIWGSYKPQSQCSWTKNIHGTKINDELMSNIGQNNFKTNTEMFETKNKQQFTTTLKISKNSVIFSAINIINIITTLEIFSSQSLGIH